MANSNRPTRHISVSAQPTVAATVMADQVLLAEAARAGLATIHVLAVPSNWSLDDIWTIAERAVRFNVGLTVLVGENARKGFFAVQAEGSWASEVVLVDNFGAGLAHIPTESSNGIHVLLTGFTDSENATATELMREHS
ncbi:MAG: hypothetical protein ACKOWN_04460 [Microbacteriaceae bacterium]